MNSTPSPSADHTTEGPLDFIVITSAALPWRTGPSSLSFSHACGLTALGYRVLYVIPWLSANSQRKLWGKVLFNSFTEHADWHKQEAERLGEAASPPIVSYRSHYSTILRSIVPLRSVFRGLPQTRVMVLEEPEHCCWPFSGRKRKDIRADHVAGFVMTNYHYYVAASGLPLAGKLAALVEGYHRWLVKRHTDQVLAISPSVAFDGFNHPVKVARVTGVLSAYFKVPPMREETTGVFFLGKLVWEKGLDEVIELARRSGTTVDLIGEGPDERAIAARAKKMNAPVRLLGTSASPWELLADYRVFFNPSRSEGLCTATADALVAGRHVILANCLANTPFFKYPNAHPYDTLDEALALLERLKSEPPADPAPIRRDFDWLQACRNLAVHCGVYPEDSGK